MEWMAGGFTRSQLLVNYGAFIAMPVTMIGLYAVQRPSIGMSGLLGAVLYGFAFVYFSHTTLLALSAPRPTTKRCGSCSDWSTRRMAR